MADISLYLTNVSVSVGQSMDVQQTQSPHPRKELESVELGELGELGMREEQQQREKVPRRIIHFSSGETMEEYSTDEEEEEDKEAEWNDLLTPPDELSKLTWGPYVWFHMWRAASSTISGARCSRQGSSSGGPPSKQEPKPPPRPKNPQHNSCDYLGERMASFFGITSAKYQYAIDEYYRRKKEREEEKEENRLSEEAERSFDHFQSQADEDEAIDMTETPEEASPHPDVTYQMENENPTPSSIIVVPAIITAT